jgi:hypothetical protein
MTILRRNRNANYTAIPNTVAEDERLSLEARGLLLYLLVKPEKWEVRITDIQKRCGVGRDKAYRLINECIEAGYIDRVAERDADGKMLRYVHIVRDEPENMPLPENPKPLPEKPDPVNQDLSKEPLVVNTHSVPDGTGAYAPNRPQFDDPRSKLFAPRPPGGLGLLSQITGKPPDRLRSVIGRWLKLTGDDPLAVQSEIEQAASDRRADPVAWISARLQADEIKIVDLDALRAEMEQERASR